MDVRKATRLVRINSSELVAERLEVALREVGEPWLRRVQQASIPVDPLFDLITAAVPRLAAEVETLFVRLLDYNCDACSRIVEDEFEDGFRAGMEETLHDRTELATFKDGKAVGFEEGFRMAREQTLPPQQPWKCACGCMEATDHGYKLGYQDGRAAASQDRELEDLARPVGKACYDMGYDEGFQAGVEATQTGVDQATLDCARDNGYQTGWEAGVAEGRAVTDREWRSKASSPEREFDRGYEAGLLVQVDRMGATSLLESEKRQWDLGYEAGLAAGRAETTSTDIR